MENENENSKKEMELLQLDLRLKHLEEKHKESHDIFRHILTAITVIFIFVGIIITILSISSKKDVDSAIREMERKFEVLSNRALEKPDIAAFYDGKQVTGNIINVSEYDEFTIPLTKLRIINIGKKPSDELTIKLYTTKKLAYASEQKANLIMHGSWKIEESPIEAYQSSAVYQRHFRLNPTEVWSTMAYLKMEFKDKSLGETMAKLIIYYGTEKPLEIDFRLTVHVK